MKLLRQFNGAAGLALASLVSLAGIAGFAIGPEATEAMDFGSRLAAPSPEHWLGTDQYGRDIMRRILAASPISVGVSLATVVIALFSGTLIGMTAGYAGGLIDRGIIVCLDAVMAFPALLLVLVFISVLGTSAVSVVIALGLAFTPTTARVVRATVLSLKQKEFVEASVILGRGRAWIVFRHLLPNCVSPLTVLATSMLATALLLESALSFLGLGVPPPAATWGGLLADGRIYLSQAPWMSVFPGLVISLALLGVNLLGDALRDLLDPRTRGEA